ncbi:hypothetical protein DFJ74DRAFT_689752 [Hyaloraphidium curvatum]|nr:hypothetical protein DFJ74DRAFT_689752 [Hyaloraphidium curvatum]
MPADVVAVEEEPVTAARLTKLLAVDVAGAAVTAVSVAPIIAIMDKSIIASASGREPLAAGVVNGFKQLFTQPLYFVRQPFFRWIVFVYSGTYIIANSVHTSCDLLKRDWQFPKFVGSSFANVSLSILKDRAFTRMLGTVAAKPLPTASYILFTTRDCMTIAASFNFPPYVSSVLQARTGLSAASAEFWAQLVSPCAMQFASAPLHLAALDMYNNPGKTFAERVSFIRSNYLGTSLARVGRILPAFGIGGNVNKAVRKAGRKMLHVSS